MSYRLDDATALNKTSDEQFTLPKNEDYWNYKSAFGGWLCAGATRALMMRSDFRGEIFSLNINFISAVSAARIALTVNLVKRKRTMDFWRVTAQDADGDDSILFAADIVSGIRREGSLTYDEPIKVDFAPPGESEKLEANPMAPRWIALFDQRLARGKPFSVNKDSTSVLWIKEADDRPLDVLSVVAFMDAPMPRTFFLQEKLNIASTLSMSTHVYASAAEITAIGAEHLILIASAAGVKHSLYNQEARLYSKDGALIATSYQTAIYR